MQVFNDSLYFVKYAMIMKDPVELEDSFFSAHNSLMI